MVFPLIRATSRPLFESMLDSIRSTRRTESAAPRGIVTFGDSSRSWRGRGPPTANPITNFSMNESEERMVESVQMQDLKTWSGSRDQFQEHRSGPDEESRGIRKHVEMDMVREHRL
ncbi:hypothetical protein ACQKWADRAFT_279099 [Trichoderma austrokoningii]